MFKSKQNKTPDRDVMPLHPRQMLEILAKLDEIDRKLGAWADNVKRFDQKLATVIDQRRMDEFNQNAPAVPVKRQRLDDYLKVDEPDSTTAYVSGKEYRALELQSSLLIYVTNRQSCASVQALVKRFCRMQTHRWEPYEVKDVCLALIADGSLLAKTGFQKLELRVMLGVPSPTMRKRNISLTTATTILNDQYPGGKV